MKDNVKKLTELKEMIAPIFEKLQVPVIFDLEDENAQLSVGDYLVCAGDHGLDIIEELPNNKGICDGANVAVLCFPSVMYAARYLISKLIF